MQKPIIVYSCDDLNTQVPSHNTAILICNSFFYSTVPTDKSIIKYIDSYSRVDQLINDLWCWVVRFALP